mgnify:CR=1 FL=1
MQIAELLKLILPCLQPLVVVRRLRVEDAADFHFDARSTERLRQIAREPRHRVGDETRALSRGEAEILALLASSRGRPLTALELLERLPTHSRVKRGTVESRIKSLRRKLGPGKLITRGRLGYELAE